MSQRIIDETVTIQMGTGDDITQLIILAALAATALLITTAVATS